jgi:hypothetical protein
MIPVNKRWLNGLEMQEKCGEINDLSSGNLVLTEGEVIDLRRA